MIDDDVVLANESDVEQKVIMPLLTGGRFLGIPYANVQTKLYLAPTSIDKAAGRKTGYYPDYSIWLHGLPVMIVEAKAPEVSPEVGYREASLYARHLNQKFPAGTNPCCRILATNGRTLLCGSWDADPDLELSVSDIRVGTTGLEALASRCSIGVLDQAAHAASRQLRLRNIHLPYDLLGGQAVLNAKRPLNTFAADLSPILRRYFSSTPQENIHEIAEKAYVSSDEVTEYDRVLESLLKDRLAFRQEAIIKPLVPTRRDEPNVTRAIASFDHLRPIHGQLQIIQGSVGVGKSLFARRYKDVLQKPEDAARTRWAFIDFNTSTMGDPATAERWVYESFIEASRPRIQVWTCFPALFSAGFSRGISRSVGVSTRNLIASRRKRPLPNARPTWRNGRTIQRSWPRVSRTTFSAADTRFLLS